MRQSITILFFFISIISFGQGLLVEKGLNDDYHQEIKQVANKNEFTYLLVQYEYNFVYLEKYDSLGNQLAKQMINPGQGFSSFVPNRMIITNDNNIWIAGFGTDACDVIHMRQHVVVYDENCQFIHAHSKNIGAFTGSIIYGALSAVSDTSVAVNYRNPDSSWVEILSPSTQAILQNVNTPDLFGFGKNNQFHLLGHTISKIYGINNQGALVDSITMPTFIREIGTWNDTIIALSLNSLFKISPDLQTITTHPIPNLSAFTRLKIDSQGVRFISSNFNKGVHYLDHALNIQSLTTVPVFDPNNTIFDFDEFVTVAKDFQLLSDESVRLANYSLSNPQSASVNRSDVEVLSLDIYDSYVQPQSTDVYQMDAKANVLIKNLGPITVDSVRLNHFISNSAICGDIVNSSYFSGLNLAPGDSMWVDFGWLGAYTNYFAPGTPVNRDYCVYSSNPNGIVDLNISNDASCESQTFGTASVTENRGIQFNMYPNPSSNFIRIEVPNGFEGKYVMQDNAGRLVQTERLNSSQINLTEFNAGVYFISIIDQNGTSSIPKKLIKR